MIRRQQRSKRPDTLFPDTTLFRSASGDEPRPAARNGARARGRHLRSRNRQSGEPPAQEDRGGPGPAAVLQDRVGRRLYAGVRGQAAGAGVVTLRLWPKSLIGQLVFAVAATLFVAQAINFALLVRGQKQQALAHGGGMAVARIVDAVERDRRGEPEQDVDDRHARHARVEKLRVSETPPHVPRRAVRRADLADYVAGLVAEAEGPAESNEAWAIPPRERARPRTALSGARGVVSW